MKGATIGGVVLLVVSLFVAQMRPVVALLVAGVLAGCGAADSGAPASDKPAGLTDRELRVAVWVKVEEVVEAFEAKQATIDSRPARDVTVAEFYEAANSASVEYSGALISARAAADEIEALVGDAEMRGNADALILDPEVLHGFVEEVRLWVEAEEHQNVQNLCRETLPEGASEEQMGQVLTAPFAECLSDLLEDPIVERGSFVAAIRIREIYDRIGRLWDSSN